MRVLLACSAAALLRGPAGDAQAAGQHGEYTQLCAGYMHEAQAAFHLTPCSDRATAALGAMADNLGDCAQATFGSVGPGSYKTSLAAYQDEFQRQCVGLCDPGCVHGKCTKFQHCEFESDWTGPRCQYAHCEGGCQEGLCVSGTAGGNHTCQCPPTRTGKNCEQEITSTPAPAEPIKVVEHRPLDNAEECTKHASALLDHASEADWICTGVGQIAYINFKKELPNCKDVFLKGEEQGLGYLKIDKSYGDIGKEAAKIVDEHCPHVHQQTT